MNNMLQIEEASAGNFDRRPFTIRHRLAGHPLFALDRLLALARRLPVADTEFHAGDVTVYASPEQVPSTGLSLEETIRRIEECGAWVVLKYVEQDPEYGALMNRCLDEVGEVYGSSLRGASDRASFIFISSAKAVTPCHIDPENNFLLQIRGSKTIHIGDRALLPEIDLERYFTGGHRSIEMPEGVESSAAVFQLSAGDGVHVPVTAPHWVVNGDGVSVSFSITFLTPKSRQKAIVHKVNAHLRRKGVRPTPPGASKLRDGFKVLGFEALRSARKLLKTVTPGRPAAGP